MCNHENDKYREGYFAHVIKLVFRQVLQAVIFITHHACPVKAKNDLTQFRLSSIS